MPGLRQIKEILGSPWFFANQPEGRSAVCRSAKKKNPWKMCKMRSVDRYEEKGWKQRNWNVKEKEDDNKKMKKEKWWRSWRDICGEEREKDLKLGKESKEQVGKREGQCYSGQRKGRSEGSEEAVSRGAVIEWDELTNSTAILEHGQDRDFYRWVSRRRRKTADRKDVTPMLGTIRMINCRE